MSFRKGAGSDPGGVEARKLIAQLGEPDDRLSKPPQLPTHATRAELIGSMCATEGCTTRGTTPILSLCRALVHAGHDPATPLEAWRGSTLRLRVRSVGEAAGLKINGKGTGFKKRRVPVGTAPPVRLPAEGVLFLMEAAE
jgi:hypothetical protein